MLPTVQFCGLTVTRLIIGANPFGGYSHQNPQRDQEMKSYYTVERIKETWGRAEAAGRLPHDGQPGLVGVDEDPVEIKKDGVDGRHGLPSPQGA